MQLFYVSHVLISAYILFTSGIIMNTKKESVFKKINEYRYIARYGFVQLTNSDSIAKVFKLNIL